MPGLTSPPPPPGYTFADEPPPPPVERIAPAATTAPPPPPGYTFADEEAAAAPAKPSKLTDYAGSTPEQFFTDLYGPEKAKSVLQSPLVAKALFKLFTSPKPQPSAVQQVVSAVLPFAAPAQGATATGLADIPVALGQKFTHAMDWLAQKTGINKESSKFNRDVMDVVADLHNRASVESGESQSGRESVRTTAATAPLMLAAPVTLPAVVATGAASGALSGLTKPSTGGPGEATAGMGGTAAAIALNALGAGVLHPVFKYGSAALMSALDKVPGLKEKIGRIVEAVGGDPALAAQNAFKKSYQEARQQGGRLFDKATEELKDRIVDPSTYVAGFDKLIDKLQSEPTDHSALVSELIKMKDSALTVGKDWSFPTAKRAADALRDDALAALKARDMGTAGAGFKAKIYRQLSDMLEKDMDRSGGTAASYWIYKKFRDTTQKPLDAAVTQLAQDADTAVGPMRLVSRGRQAQPLPQVPANDVLPGQTLDMEKVTEMTPGGKPKVMQEAKDFWRATVAPYIDKKLGARTFQNFMNNPDPTKGLEILKNAGGPVMAKRVFDAAGEGGQKAIRAAMMGDLAKAVYGVEGNLAEPPCLARSAGPRSC